MSDRPVPRPACPVCGKHHVNKVEGDYDTMPDLYVCPSIPEGMIWADTEHEKGPRGSLYRMEEKPDA